MDIGPATIPHAHAPARSPHPASTPRDQAAGLRSLALGNQPTPPPVAPVRPAAMRTVSISSGKGGVGKTNIAVNLAVALQARGLRTTLLDLDVGLANADLLCGLNPLRRIDRAGDGSAHLADVTVLAPGGFALVPGSVAGRRASRATADAGRSVGPVGDVLGRLDELAPTTDVLLIDTGAGIGPTVLAAMHAAQLHLIVTTPEPPALADAYALTKVAGAAMAGRFLPAMVVNQCRNGHEAGATCNRLCEVSERFLGRPLPLLGEIPFDPCVAQSVRDRRPFALAASTCPATGSIRRLAECLVNMLGMQTIYPQYVESSGGVLGRLAWLIGARVARSDAFARTPQRESRR